MASKTIDFKVVGEQKIHCEGCEQRVGNALRRLPGVENVETSHKTQDVRVQVDPAQVSAEQVQAKLDQLGYEAAQQRR